MESTLCFLFLFTFSSFELFSSSRELFCHNRWTFYCLIKYNSQQSNYPCTRVQYYYVFCTVNNVTHRRKLFKHIRYYNEVKPYWINNISVHCGVGICGGKLFFFWLSTAVKLLRMWKFDRLMCTNKWSPQSEKECENLLFNFRLC